MEALDPSSPSLLGLPVEIHAIILTHLRFPDLHTLRLTNHYFHALVPRPTHAELLIFETSEFAFHKLLACVGCTRLRPISTFSSKMFKKKKVPGGAGALSRFCIECGRRPLPGLHRYALGARWEEDGIPFARCHRCTMIAMGPDNKAVPLCLSCHRQDLERARAANELKRVQREAREREERRRLRAERRRAWIKGGGALSDSFLDDTSEEEDGQTDWWEWGLDDDMNSAHS